MRQSFRTQEARLKCLARAQAFLHRPRGEGTRSGDRAFSAKHGARIWPWSASPFRARLSAFLDGAVVREARLNRTRRADPGTDQNVKTSSKLVANRRKRGGRVGSI